MTDDSAGSFRRLARIMSTCNLVGALGYLVLLLFIPQLPVKYCFEVLDGVWLLCAVAIGWTLRPGRTLRMPRVRQDQFGTDPDLPVEQDPFVQMGHPYTCNGGNPDFSTHHDHEAILIRDGDVLRCPECGRTQPLRRLP